MKKLILYYFFNRRYCSQLDTVMEAHCRLYVISEFMEQKLSQCHYFDLLTFCYSFLHLRRDVTSRSSDYCSHTSWHEKKNIITLLPRGDDGKFSA